MSEEKKELDEKKKRILAEIEELRLTVKEFQEVADDLEKDKLTETAI